MRLAVIYADQGKYQQALIHARESRMLWTEAYAHARAGQRAEAEAVLARDDTGIDAAMLASADTNVIYAARQSLRASNRAAVYAALGDHEAAFRWLDRALKVDHFNVIDLRYNRLWDPLRQDPRFIELLRRVGGPDPSGGSR